MILIIEDKLCYIETMSIDICSFFREQIDLLLYSCSWPENRQWKSMLNVNDLSTLAFSSDSSWRRERMSIRETLRHTERIQQSISQVQLCPVHIQTEWCEERRREKKRIKAISSVIVISFFFHHRLRKDHCLLSWWIDSHLNRQTDVLINAICSWFRLNEEQISFIFIFICVTVHDESMKQLPFLFLSFFSVAQSTSFILSFFYLCLNMKMKCSVSYTRYSTSFLQGFSKDDQLNWDKDLTTERSIFDWDFFRSTN